MLISPELMRFLLIASMVSMALLALFYLRTRVLAPVELLAWGLLAVLVPFLGPFLVILLKPGTPRRRFPRRAPPGSKWTEFRLFGRKFSWRNNLWRKL
jgi:hypothetical protein